MNKGAGKVVRMAEDGEQKRRRTEKESERSEPPPPEQPVEEEAIELTPGEDSSEGEVIETGEAESDPPQTKSGAEMDSIQVETQLMLS